MATNRSNLGHFQLRTTVAISLGPFSAAEALSGPVCQLFWKDSLFFPVLQKDRTDLLAVIPLKCPGVSEVRVSKGFLLTEREYCVLRNPTG